jgi:hypothetical protein
VPRDNQVFQLLRAEPTIGLSKIKKLKPAWIFGSARLKTLKKRLSDLQEAESVAASEGDAAAKVLEGLNLDEEEDDTYASDLPALLHEQRLIVL